jgi:glycosyltransferase involved in cell wall biosynthesis
MSKYHGTNVAADLRWPSGTGIGLCQKEHLIRMPNSISIEDIGVNFKIGNPLSTLSIAHSLANTKKNYDVFWSPGFIPPAYSHIPAVVTVHDLTHLHFYSSLHAGYYDYILRPFYRKCAAVICVSEHTRNEFLNWSGMPENKVTVIYNGVSRSYNKDVEPYRPGYPYIFYPGNKRVYKNLILLLKAFRNSTLPNHGIKLLMTGHPTVDLSKTIHELGLFSSVIFLGFVPDENLPAVYRGAEFTAFISLYEGFGLPIVESMAVGTPVITSNISSMPEISCHASKLVNPSNLDEIVEAMNNLLLDNSVRKDLSARGFLRAEFFSWDKSSTSTWNLLQKIARTSKTTQSTADSL